MGRGERAIDLPYTLPGDSVVTVNTVAHIELVVEGSEPAAAPPLGLLRCLPSTFDLTCRWLSTTN